MKKIKIMGHKYKVYKRRRLSESNGAPGLCCMNTKKIIIGSNYPKSRRKEAFLHEIVEALKYHLELTLEHSDLSALSEGLYQVIHDNKLKF